MITAHRRIWRTDLYLSTLAGMSGDRLQDRLDTAIERLDLAANRFRPDSGVARVSGADGAWVEADEYLLDLLRTAKAVAAATSGLVHPGLGAQVRAAGYDEWAGHTKRPGHPHDLHSMPWTSIELSDEGWVRIPRGMVLDLGASAKAWLADHLAVELAQETDRPVIANMGGDIRVISREDPLRIGLDPLVPGVTVRVLDLRDAGVATSGLAHRRWQDGHHIIDPRTGKPALATWWSASAVAANAVGANAAATAAIVLAAEAEQWLSDLGVSAWLVSADGCETDVGPWPGHDTWRIA